MPKVISPGRLAAAMKALSGHLCDANSLRSAVLEVARDKLGLQNPRLVTSESQAGPEDLLIPLSPTLFLVCEYQNNIDVEILGAYGALASALIGQAACCQRSQSEQASIMARLDQVRRDLDSAHRNEWIAHERMRIAQDLHDRAAQTLFGLGLTADWLLTHVETANPLYGDLERMKQMSATGLRQVREAIFSLSSAPVEPANLRQAIRALLKDVESAGIVGTLQVWGEVGRLTADVSDALYQIIREALINVRRHSQATSVLVSLRIDPTGVTAVVQDDGVGLTEAVAETFRKNGAHLGLRGMESRAERLGGKLTLAPGDECGLIVTTTLPLKGVASHG